MEALPGTIVTTRGSTLSKCAATCHNAAGAAVCPDLATTCQCTNANFRSDFLSCVQGECQAAELDNAQQFVTSLSLSPFRLAGASPPLTSYFSLTAKSTATVPFLPTNTNTDVNEPSHTTVSLSSLVDSRIPSVSLTAKSTATVPFLPTNATTDVNEPSHTSVSLSSPSSSARNASSSPGENITATYNHAPAQTSQETGSPNTGSTQTVDRNGAPAGATAASVVIIVLIVVLVIFLWWWIRRRRQRIRERRFPAPFLESASPVQRVVRSPSIIKVAAATDVEIQAGVAGTTMAQGVALDETQPEKGAPAWTHDPQLINSSDVPAEENAAQASNAQDAAHTEEAVTVRLRRVEAQLAALLTTVVESPEELPPSYWG
ncbi:hypothetical protein B0H13DRAFT_2327835 [Mycena leptocephala]|nr:hypothetical protein B0H13DRAFT_2327835 [Mycena leptocephala]